MPSYLYFTFSFRFFLTLALSIGLAASLLAENIRVFLETDLGGDPDDQASLVRFLMYSNEWDIEGIIVDRSAESFAEPYPKRVRYGKEQTSLEMINDYFFTAWDSVHANLLQHDDRYLTAALLRSLTVAGYDATNDGVALILRALAKDDARPLYYSNWGSDSGTTSNLKRALDRLKSSDPAAYELAVKKLRNVSIDANARKRNRLGEHYDRLFLNVETGWPEKYGTGYGTRWYHRFRSIAGANPSDVSSEHGSLGKLWTGPKEGDSWCVLYLIPNGLSDPELPEIGGWAGRYVRRTDAFSGSNHFWNDAEDAFSGTMHRDNTAKRYQDAIRNDFAARMDWCVKPFSEANHPPVPSLVLAASSVTQGILKASAARGATIELAASATDPDGDSVAFRWVPYREAGSFDGELALSVSGEKGQVLSFTVPLEAAAGDTLHLYVEATDDGTPALTRYCRLLLTVVDSGR